MVAWRYGISLLVFNSISHEWAQQTSEISSWALEEKLDISARPRIIIHVITFCSLLPLRRKLLCRPSEWVSEWVSECNNRIRAQRALSISIRCFPIFETSPETDFSSEYVTEMLHSYIFGPSVVKYDILINNRRVSFMQLQTAIFPFPSQLFC